MRLIKRLLIGLFIVAIAVILGLGYLGFVPGLSNILGASKPKNLGVTYTAVDFNSIMSKNHVKLVVLEKAPTVRESFVLQGSQTISNAFTDKEITARLAKNDDWPLSPFTDVQVKIGQGGIVEASGIVHVDRLRLYAEATGVSQTEIDAIAKGMDTYKIPRGSFPAYVKGTLSIKDNNLDINLSQLMIGKVPIPETLYRQAKVPFESFVHERLTSGGYGSLSVKSLTFSDGMMRFSGTIPKTVTTAKTILGGQ